MCKSQNGSPVFSLQPVDVDLRASRLTLTSSSLKIGLAICANLSRWFLTLPGFESDLSRETASSCCWQRSLKIQVLCSLGLNFVGVIPIPLSLFWLKLICFLIFDDKDEEASNLFPAGNLHQNLRVTCGSPLQPSTVTSESSESW